MSKTDSHEWQQTIAPLIYRIQKRDKQALKLLYDQCASRLLNVIMRILKDQHEAEDILQEVFVKLWHQADKFSGTGSAWGWLCVLARNAAIDRHRSLRNRATSIEEELPLIDALVEQSANLQDQHWLNRCLKVLKEQPRKAILLAFVYGHSHSELAEELAAPLGTVKAWVRRGLQELRQCLDT